MPGDRYEDYYAAKLWQLVPATYRAEDSAPYRAEDGKPGAKGPLREIVDRIGAQAAVLRRSIDRLWEDQSIESCDDWIIPYVGDLLATKLVACLDSRAQRLDVAKTIYYRRRKGTVGLLEELASDIAGRDAQVSEFFRRLARTRHNFDPPIGSVPMPSVSNATSDALELTPARPSTPLPLAIAEGLSGIYTRTPMGGYANLRHGYGASKATGPFDEYFYTADFRRGRRSVGWHNIPRLGVFVWWLKTYRAPPTTPVAYARCPGQYTFDPTGREIPLFSATRRGGDNFGEAWTSPDEWELPVEIQQSLFDLRPDELYPDPLAPDPQENTALSVLEGDTPPYVVMGLARVAINLRRGRFRLTAGPPSANQIHVCYSYGFGSEIGAGTYERRGGGAALPEQVTSVTGGGARLATAAAGIGATGTLSIDDSLTYSLPGSLDGGGGGIVDLAQVGKDKERPVIRAVGASRPEWIIMGAPDSTLVVEGIHLAGADLVLRGEFESVTIRCATLDPGASGAALSPPTLFAPAADDAPLWPTRLFVEAKIKTLTIVQCIAGPIRTRAAGAIEKLNISDSIVQAITELGGDLDFAIFTRAGTTELVRSTVFGKCSVHRLSATECIFDDVVMAINSRYGCVRFCAYAEGSKIHQPYESVTVAPGAPLFLTRDFGYPNYARLRESADDAITSGRPGASILEGAQNGSEMGAFCREAIALKRRGLNQKFSEYMPVGLAPVWIDAS